MDVHFKDDVPELQALRLPILRAIVVAAGVLAGFGLRFTITSLNDGRHSRKSFHYHGMALDIRTRDEGPTYAQWPLELKNQIADALRNALGGDYDVVVESTHLHVEFDAK